MSVYLILVLSSAAAAFTLFAIMNLFRRDRAGARAAALSLPLGALLGFLFAKGSFLLLTGEYSALLSLDPADFCFTGGAIGVCLGVWLAAKILRYPLPGAFLDRFAFPGALLAAALRMAEMELGSLGTGRYIQTPSGSSFLILAVYNRYGEPHVAVFVWEAVTAAVIAFLSLRGRPLRPGQCFRTAVFRLCACQILLENLRSRALMWGFVRIEQVLCAVILLLLMFSACRQSEKKRAAARYLPVGLLLLSFGAIVGIEFLRQRSSSLFMGEHGGFLMMAAVLLAVLYLYRSQVTDPHPPGNPGTNP